MSPSDLPADNCTNNIQCVNCKGDHPAYSRPCPFWKQEKEIIKLKISANTSFPEARKRLSFLQKGTFSEAVGRRPAPSSVPAGPSVCQKCRGSCGFRCPLLLGQLDRARRCRKSAQPSHQQQGEEMDVDVPYKESLLLPHL